MKLAAEIRKLAPNIGKDAEEVLADMYSAKQLNGTASDKAIEINCSARISIAQGAQINQFINQAEINKTLEIGFAYGFSTIWILDALRAREKSHHTAIDPFEMSYWGGIGLHQVERLRVAPESFKWIDECSIHSLSRLIKSGETYDLIYVDGNHRFDDVLVDFYLSDQLLLPEGVLIFDDMWMPSIRTVISFILTNRQYKIIPQPVQNMVVLKKIANDNRNWRHFEKFRVHTGNNAKFQRLVLRLARATGSEELLRQMRSRFRSL